MCQLSTVNPGGFLFQSSLYKNHVKRFYCSRLRCFWLRPLLANFETCWCAREETFRLITKESRFWNGEIFACGIPNPANFCCGIQNLGLWNLEYSSRNLESHCRLESRIQAPLTKNPKSTAWNPHPRLSWIPLQRAKSRFHLVVVVDKGDYNCFIPLPSPSHSPQNAILVF